MKIAYISYECPPDTCNGGIATYIGQIARVMAARGHAVEVFAGSLERSAIEEQDSVLFHRIKVEAPAQFRQRVGEYFASRFRQVGFDVLEGTEFNADAAEAVRLVPELPLVVRMHTPTRMLRMYGQPSVAEKIRVYMRNHVAKFARACMQGRFQPHLLRRYLRDESEVFRLEQSHAVGADLVLAPCHDLADYAIHHWHVPERSVRVVPYAYVPNSQYLSLPPVEKAEVVGFVGRLEKKKGIELLASVIPRVLAKHPHAIFRFVGLPGNHPDGLPYDQWLKKRLPRLADRLSFVGKVPLPDMHTCYAGLDLCVFPSLWENFPNVCLEAMSAARAVVGSSGGGMREMLDNGKYGRIGIAGDPNSWAVAINSLLGAPTECHRLGVAARQRILDRYNAARVGQEMEDAYQLAIERKQSQPGARR